MNFDALKHVETLKKAGVPDDQATAQVRVLNEIIDSNLATKRDWKEMEQATRRDIKELEHKMKETEQATRRDIKELEHKMKETEQATRRDIKELEHKIKELEHKMKEMEQRIIIKLGSLLTTGLVAIVALSKLNII